MHFENRAIVSASRETLWDFLMDVPSIGGCVPGVENIQAVDADTYQAQMKVRVGPIGLRFDGKMRIVERDRDNWRAVMKAEGKDKGAAGAVSANIVMSLVERSSTETELVVVTDASVLGKIGEFGEPVMRKKADAIMSEFARNVGQRVGG